MSWQSTSLQTFYFLLLVPANNLFRPPVFTNNLFWGFYPTHPEKIMVRPLNWWMLRTTLSDKKEIESSILSNFQQTISISVYPHVDEVTSNCDIVNSISIYPTWLLVRLLTFLFNVLTGRRNGSHFGRPLTPASTSAQVSLALQRACIEKDPWTDFEWI